jgi:hypothetical protein
MKGTRNTRLTAIAACLILAGTALLSGCLPRSKHPSPAVEELLLGAGMRPVDRASPPSADAPILTSLK